MGLIQDNEGNTSHKRLINVLACVCAVILTLGLPAWAIYNKIADIGQNTMILIVSLWSISAGGAIVSNIVERIKNGSNNNNPN